MTKLKFPYFGKVLVEAIQELDSLNVYPLYDNYKYFQVLVPGYDEPFTGSILGNAGEFFGLNLFVGKDGLATYRSFCEDHHDLSPERLRKLNMYAYELLPPPELSDENRKWIKAAGVKLLPDEYYPDFNVHRPGKVVSLPDDKDVTILLYAVKGVVQAIKNNVFAPSDLRSDSDDIFTIKTSGKSISPQIEILNAPETKAKPTKPKAAPQKDLSGYEAQTFEFRPLPRVKGIWAVHAFATMAAVGDNLMSILAVIDIAAGVRHFELLVGEQQDNVEEIWEVLRNSLKGESISSAKMCEPALPDAFVFFDPQLCAIADKVFAPLNIKCTVGDTKSELYAELERLAALMNEKLAMGPDAALEEMKNTLPEEEFEKILSNVFDKPEGLPDDDDYQGWEELDGKFKAMIFKGFNNDKKFKDKRALTEYFGTIANYNGIRKYDEIFSRYIGLLVVDSYCNWFVTDYRATHKSETLLEKWLVDPKVDPLIQYIIEQFMFGINGFFKLEVKDKKKGKIIFTDMLDENNEQYEIIDFGLAATAKSGLYMPAKIYRLGNYDFYAAMGPILTAFEYSTVMRLYEKSDVDINDGDEFDESAYLFGWLWRYYELFDSERKSVLNADGDQIIIHTSLFSVDDEEVVSEKLKALSFIDYDKNNDIYLWFRPNLLTTSPLKSPPDAISVLGVLRFSCGKLIAETNSEKRYEKCRKWLDKIEGISFVSVEKS